MGTWIGLMIVALVVAVVAAVSAAVRRDNAGSHDADVGLGCGVGLVTMIVIGGIVTLSCSAVVVQPGEAGVRMVFGSFAGDPLPNGMHFVAPWINVIRYPTKIQQYTMDHRPGEGQSDQGDDSIPVLCQDGLQMKIDATVFYRPDPKKLNWVHENLGPNYMDQYLRPMIRKAIPEVFGVLDSMDVSTIGRDGASKAVLRRLFPDFSEMGIILEDVNLRNIQPPQTVLDAIAAKLAAVERAQQMESEGKGLVARARGEAEANRIREGSLSVRLIQWEQIQAWRDLAESSNTKVLIPAGSDLNLLLSP